MPDPQPGQGTLPTPPEGWEDTHMVIMAFCQNGPAKMGCALWPVNNVMGCDTDAEKVCEVNFVMRKAGGGTENWFVSKPCDGNPIAKMTSDPIFGDVWWCIGTLEKD